MVDYTDGDIPGQALGDEIALLKKQQNGMLAEHGTTETVVNVTARPKGGRSALQHEI